MQKKVFQARYGSMYKESGRFIDNIAFIFSKDTGVCKWGEPDSIKEQYKTMKDNYNKARLFDMADNLVYIEFDKYKSILSLEDICTLSNYIIYASAKLDLILKLLSQDTELIRSEIRKLRDMGF